MATLPSSRPLLLHADASLPTTRPIRVVVVDDAPGFRAALMTFLDRRPELAVVGAAGDGLAALALVTTTQPDVVVMDLQLPELCGIAATRRLQADGAAAQVVLLTVGATAATVAAGLRAGAHGTVPKAAIFTSLPAAIQAAAAVPSPAPVRLTRRERAVLQLVASGMENTAIAVQLQLTHGTVRNYISTVIGKLQVGNRREAVTVAQALGLIT